jgi:hypothetical protein
MANLKTWAVQSIMKNIDEIQKILERNNYQIIIRNIENGIIVTYPEKLEPPALESEITQFFFTQNGIRIIIYSNDGNIVSDKTVPCCIYAQKIIVFCHIILRCIFMDFPLPLIKFILNDIDVSEDEFYNKCENILMLEDDYKLDELLRPIIIKCVFNPGLLPVAEKVCEANGTLEGFLVYKSLITAGNKNNEET